VGRSGDLARQRHYSVTTCSLLSPSTAGQSFLIPIYVLFSTTYALWKYIVDFCQNTIVSRIRVMSILTSLDCSLWMLFSLSPESFPSLAISTRIMLKIQQLVLIVRRSQSAFASVSPTLQLSASSSLSALRQPQIIDVQIHRRRMCVIWRLLCRAGTCSISCAQSMVGDARVCAWTTATPSFRLPFAYVLIDCTVKGEWYCDTVVLRYSTYVVLCALILSFH